MTSAAADPDDAPISDGPRLLVIEVDVAASTRRAIGTTAWSVLEALAGRADTAPPLVEVRCGCRELAEDLGLSKDTTARALRHLARHGLVRRMDHRGEENGRFAATTYEVDLAMAGFVTVTVSRSSDAGGVADATDLSAAQRQRGSDHRSVGSTHGSMAGQATPADDAEPSMRQLTLLD